MKNKKNTTKKIKEAQYISDDQQEIIRFIKILVIVILFILGVYFATRLFVKKDLLNNSEETPVTEVSYSKMVFGTMLNRPYEEYYVMAYSSENNNANYYRALIDKYSSEEESLFVYYIDLEDSMNERFIAEDAKTNPDAKNIDELRVGEVTLIKVKDGKISKYIENVDDIKRELSIK